MPRSAPRSRRKRQINSIPGESVRQPAPKDCRQISTTPFADLVGQEIINLVLQVAPTKVGSRVGKALDHYTKALRLIGVDDEMGAIRCIAAEEELVVAIFEWLKLNSDKVPEHSDFIRKYKNHRVKLAFYPVLSQLRFAIGGMLEQGITFTGLEEHIHWSVTAIRVDDQVKLQIRNEAGEDMIRLILWTLLFLKNIDQMKKWSMIYSRIWQITFWTNAI
jgi:hypothetical protein